MVQRPLIFGTNQGDPNWAANVMERVEKARAERAIRHGHGDGVRPTLSVNSSREWLDLLHAAARTRGVSLSAYVRRLVSIAASQDLGVPLGEILALTPEPIPLRDKTLRKKSGPDTGEGIQAWCVHPGCDGSHLRLEE